MKGKVVKWTAQANRNDSKQGANHNEMVRCLQMISEWDQGNHLQMKQLINVGREFEPMYSSKAQTEGKADMNT